jgi:hypothetical protein
MVPDGPAGRSEPVAAGRCRALKTSRSHIVYTDGCAKWLQQLSPTERNRLLARAELVAEQGPGLGRPVVEEETIKGSRHPNMKEIRSGTIRVLFAFDPVGRPCC